MAAYLIGNITVHDQALWRRYVAGVGRSLQPFDAEVVFRGRRAAVLCGHQQHELVVVIRYRDMQELNKWFTSEAYQSLVSLRDRAADVTITTYSSQ